MQNPVFLCQETLSKTVKKDTLDKDSFDNLKHKSYIENAKNQSHSTSAGL